jgi:hypothetical protein
VQSLPLLHEVEAESKEQKVKTHTVKACARTVFLSGNSRGRPGDLEASERKRGRSERSRDEKIVELEYKEKAHKTTPISERLESPRPRKEGGHGAQLSTPTLVPPKREREKDGRKEKEDTNLILHHEQLRCL